MECRSLRRAVALTAIVGLGVGGGRMAGRAQEPAPRDPARELAASVADGFTLTTVGDLIFARPMSQTADPAFRSVVKLLQAGDVTFGNFEGSALDIRHFKGYPAAEFGGVWIIGPPDVARDLKAMGFDMVSRANNHTTDWGLEGMRLTNAALDEAGIVHAGSGESRSAARAGRYIDTPRGRVALVSMASSFTPMSQAMDPVGEAPGRPGLSAVRVTREVFVTADELERLRKIRDEQPAGSFTPNPDEPKDRLTLFGTSYRVGPARGYTYSVNAVDEAEIVKTIRHAKMSADFVIATIHAHDPGNWSEQPADFLPVLARKAIDAGADAWVGHGPHQLRGIEVYKGKPILYSLGNFIFQLDLLQPVGNDLRFQVTITRTDAALGKYTFGSLTWVPNSPKYETVRSPIAVKPMAVSAPVEVTGTGTSGATDITVTPGFTGTLKTDVDGLIPSDVVAQSVVREDGTPLDGYFFWEVTKDTKVSRFATYDEEVAAKDIDLYVYRFNPADSTVSLVDLSGNEGSSEELTLRLAPGIYVVSIDLYSPEPSVSVPVHTWDVTDADADNLTVQPASASVTMAQPVTFTAAWSGLTAGQRYLGQVNFLEGDTPAGSTLVTVNP